ncbi:MAG: helix-turn-helix domain-containing protein [Pseudomonadota bacterium]
MPSAAVAERSPLEAYAPHAHALKGAIPQPLRPGRPALVPHEAFDAMHGDCFICRLRQSWLAADRFRAGGAQPWLVSGRKTVQRGQLLFRNGDPLRHLYAVHAGQFKSSTTAADGRTQVTGFHVSGELLGLDGIGTGHHAGDAVALEDAQVCVIGYHELLQMLGGSSELQKSFWQLMGSQIARDHQVMLWLGSLKAEERVASFLLNLLDRLHTIGFSSSALVLRMTREEIGSYLGLTLETVSRAFSRFKQLGLLEVKERDIRIVDRNRLLRLSCRP